MVRNSDKGAKVASQYPKVKLVYGDLDAVDVIEEEAKKADIVYRELHLYVMLLLCVSLTFPLGRFRQLRSCGIL